MHFARQVTALDDVSAGRLLLGLGAGGIGFDSAVLGGETLPPRQRVDRFAEFIELLDLILREDGTTWRGEYFAAVDARSNPGCVQQPRVPFVVAANGPRSMRLAARFGAGLGDHRAPATTTTWTGWWRSRGGAVRADRPRRWTRPAAIRPAWTATSRSTRRRSSRCAARSYFADAVGRAAELGFTDVVTHWPRASELVRR